MKQRSLSPADRFIQAADNLLRTLNPSASSSQRDSPAAGADEGELTPSDRRHAAGLMRVNHTGEVCAQALYRGQAATARLSEVREEMEHAAQEEIDHLVWCEQRLAELDSHTSRLNPVWYGASFLLGAAAGIAGDRWSLGFVAATEERVCEHLSDHLERLPVQDKRSRRIVEQMLEDERRHGEQALAAGGTEFPAPVKQTMGAVSKLMTSTSYRV